MLSSDFPRAERRIFLKKDTRKLITCIAVPLATGAVSGFFTRNGMKVFAKLNKPPYHHLDGCSLLYGRSFLS